MYDGPISFVVITRNHAPYIVDCLRSIVAQPTAGELIVVDNASKDDTARNAAEFLNSYRGPLTTQLIALPYELPLCRFMNFAVTLARHPIVKPFSGDDMLGPNFVSIFRQMTAPKHGHADLWMACALFVDSSARWPTDGVHPAEFASELGEESKLQSSVETITGKPRHNQAHVTMIYRRDVWAALGGYDERFAYEDRSFMFNLVRAGYVARLFPVTTVYYRIHSSAISQDPAFMARARVPVLYDIVKKAHWEDKPLAGYELLRNVRIVARDRALTILKRIGVRRQP